jgi:hypothetical protein
LGKSPVREFLLNEYHSKVFVSLRDDIEKDAYVDYFTAVFLMDAFFYSICLKPKMLDVKRKGSARKVSVEIKSCNDFMKRGFAAQFGERLKFLSPHQATEYFGIFTTAHKAVVPNFRFKKDLILYLNSSRSASSGEFEFKRSFMSLILFSKKSYSFLFFIVLIDLQ